MNWYANVWGFGPVYRTGTLVMQTRGRGPVLTLYRDSSARWKLAGPFGFPCRAAPELPVVLHVRCRAFAPSGRKAGPPLSQY